MHQLAIQIEALKGQEAMVSLFRNAYAIVFFFFHILAITCSKLTKETLEQRLKSQSQQYRHQMDNFVYNSHILLMFPLFTLKK